MSKNNYKFESFEDLNTKTNCPDSIVTYTYFQLSITSGPNSFRYHGFTVF